MHHQGHLRFHLFTLDSSLGTCLTSMCNAAGTRSRGAEAFTFVAVVILMVGAMTFEEVCPGEGFGANLSPY